MVYYTRNKCHQYAIAFYDNSIYEPNELYYTAEEALKVGIDCIQVVIGYR
jgi:thiamine monophosphate synthase